MDPPPFSQSALNTYGVTPGLIDKIILTHCHADHDAGVFQKILSGNTIEFITTATIMESFSRKYAALAAMSLEEIQSLFNFRPVTIGKELEIFGAKFKFFYSFHMIPCIVPVIHLDSIIYF